MGKRIITVRSPANLVGDCRHRHSHRDNKGEQQSRDHSAAGEHRFGPPGSGRQAGGVEYKGEEVADARRR